MKRRSPKSFEEFSEIFRIPQTKTWCQHVYTGMEHGRDHLPESLPDYERQIAELRQQNTQLQATLSEYHEHLTQAAAEIALLKKALWSPRRERYLPDPNQATLFRPESLGASSENTPSETTAVEPSGESDGSGVAPARKKRGSRQRVVFPQFLERRRIDHPLPEDERACGGCGQERVVIQQHVSEQLEIEPAKVYVSQHVRYTYACSKCRQGDQMVTPPKSPQVLEKGLLGPTVAAYVLELRFGRHVPYYRQQEMLLTSLKQWLSRPLLCGLMRRVGEALAPLCDLIRLRVLASFLIHADETTMPLLDRDSNKTLTAYLWGYGAEVDFPYVYYDFSDSRSRDGPLAVLANYRGYLQTDGYSAYEAVVRESQGRMIDVACWAHARRKFDEARFTTGHPLLHEALGWIQQMYDLEDQARSCSAEERLRLRVAQAVPILDRMQMRFDAVAPELRPSTKLAEAVEYAHNRWEALKRYTGDGRIPIDNNEIERLFRGVAVGRKNFLFVGSRDGGRTAARLYTIVQSAKRNNLALGPYLNDVLQRLPMLVDQGASLDCLLPDHWAREHPHHVLTERQEESREARQRRDRRRTLRRAAAAQE
jgi:transposase